ncbi:MAG: hypothetical protein F4155_14915, partial [Acidimicrobiales bacterium]|nr:hypothetical protein [Acidimicrobiales bacterium]
MPIRLQPEALGLRPATDREARAPGLSRVPVPAPARVLLAARVAGPRVRGAGSVRDALSALDTVLA